MCEQLALISYHERESLLDLYMRAMDTSPSEKTAKAA